MLIKNMLKSGTMWPFKRKKSNPGPVKTSIPCPFCGSLDTGLIMNHGTDHPNYVKVWRGQRAVTCRCFGCGRDFYSEDSRKGTDEGSADDDRLIDDEEALRAAEEELKKQIDESGDHRCP